MLLRRRLQRPGVLERPRLTMTAYRSASPLAFQAFWPPEELEEYRRRHPFVEQGAAIWKSKDKLDAFLHLTREVGYALPPIFPPDQFRAAVPVFGKGQRLMGALGLGLWLKARMDARKLIKDMLEASRQIGDLI
jgi:DNA-binding IclR family transcriptional regulator